MFFYVYATISILFIIATPSFTSNDTKTKMADARKYLKLKPDACKWCNMKEYVEKLKKQNQKPRNKKITNRPQTKFDFYNPYHGSAHVDNIEMNLGREFLSEILNKLPQNKYTLKYYFVSLLLHFY